MKKEEFEQQIQTMIPQPSPETTSALYELGLDTMDEAGPQSILAAFDFIARNFDRSVLQSAYEIIRHGSAALPGEMVAAAVFLQNGDTPARMSQMAEQGYLMCFHTPKETGESSPLAICTVTEDGETRDFYSTRFGKFEPEKVFSRAKRYAEQQGISVTQALQCAAVDGKIGMELHEGQKLMTARWPEMTKALSDIFERCPAVAARIVFNVDQDSATVEHNPLRWEPAKVQQIKSTPFRGPFGEHELTVTVCSYAQNGRLAVNLLCKEDDFWEPYASLTVNLPKEQLRANEAFIKDFDENTGLLDFVLKNRLGTLCPEKGHSGLCIYPKIAFDMEKLREFDPEGTEKYLYQSQQKKRTQKRKER